MKPQDEWRLTAGQIRALDAQLEHICESGAADALGVSVKTVSAQTVRARDKMGARNRFETLLAWDRVRRAQQCI
jgi:hypothetical protein